MALLIFGVVCNVVGLILVLGAGHFHMRERIAPTSDDEEPPEFRGSWSIAAGGFLIIIGSATMTYELIDHLP
ncbi:MAG: hypothetical protein M3490_06675 [Chloroflexota bacterium]|nr:hypothetical protein [Chloroflexota bacterium]